MRRRWLASAIALNVALCPGIVRGAGEEQQPAVLRAVQYLRGQASSQRVGEAALTGLALVKAEVPAADPGVAACLKKVLTRFDGAGFTPERGGPGGIGIYETAVIILFLSNLDPVTYKPQIEAAAHYLMANQLAAGCWDYEHRQKGDTSISQYAVLGLWEADNSGVVVPLTVWDRAASWFLSVQDAQGAWSYHRDEPNWPNTVSMTAAGVGSLLICKRQMELGRQMTESSNPLLRPVLTDPRASPNFRPQTTAREINNAVARGMAWIGTRFLPGEQIMGSTTYYGLYGIERIGALADRETLGRMDWYALGLRYLNSNQRGDGSWSATYGEVVNTAWGILFATRSTAKTIQHVELKRLGAGTLIGGRGLPKDLSSMTVAGGRVLSRPMSGAVEGMLAVLEDPRADNADGALTGIIARYDTEGPKALRPFKDRFRKLLSDRDPGIRGSAAWALARTGDLDVAPDLITALTDTDEDVVAQARGGLQLLSRKIDGFGPADGADLPARQEAAKKWRVWYDSVRTIEPITSGQ